MGVSARMTAPRPTLILVYNAKGGMLNAVRDAVHKLLSPATYPCSLCALTYSAVSMRGAWREFLDLLGMPVMFLYRDEFERDLDRSGVKLPAILLGGDGPEPHVLLNGDDLREVPDLPALIAATQERLAAAAM